MAFTKRNIRILFSVSKKVSSANAISCRGKRLWLYLCGGGLGFILEELLNTVQHHAVHYNPTNSGVITTNKPLFIHDILICHSVNNKNEQ